MLNHSTYSPLASCGGYRVDHSKAGARLIPSIARIFVLNSNIECEIEMRRNSMDLDQEPFHVESLKKRKHYIADFVEIAPFT